ncbi:PAAR motif-containing protein [Serratia fonticola]|uniref:PAAR motif-containing protein n=1 Tax=Serratia fonticola TaxID=47917 RepID=A0A542BM41_SERFO|nr:PAAR domain-containing protein [Serratia fonticola]TQI79674.1 PAAR motif-containing protein [Serratia fonticola]TQI98300.1 PAAR motif-containing protein [Serratia fonticola]TVZ67828.1 PAAR motif-containing protein [Serratia fonticola]
MAKTVIVLGDKTDHGGVVTTACSGFKSQGSLVACEGDTVVCPQHDTTVIGHAQGAYITGSQRMYKYLISVTYVGKELNALSMDFAQQG